MSRRHAAAAILATALTLLLSCGKASAPDSDFHVSVNRGDRNGQARSSEGSPGRAAPMEGPRLPPRDGETLLGTIGLDVDEDPDDEQILVVKRLESSSSYIGIVVLDKEGQRNAWVRVWEETTLATKYPTFNVSIKDLLGTREKDLVCTGLNDSDRQTLLALHPDRQGAPGAPLYRRIAAIEADSIAIEETARSTSYSMGQSDEAPWEITARDQDLLSKNFLDQVETRWAWNPATAAYAPGPVKAVSGQAIEKKFVDTYLTGDVAAFERLLSGIWYLQSGPPPGSKGSRLIEFSPEFKTIVFSQDSDIATLSAFNWDNSESTKRGVYATLSHTEIKLKRFVDIELVGPDAISLKSTDNIRFNADVVNEWNGLYRKLAARDPLPSPSQAGLALPSGTYRSAEGDEISFNYPRFSWKSASGEDGGVYSSYWEGADQVIVFKSVKQSGVITRTRSFILGRPARPGSRGFSLAPAVITVYGAERLEQEILYFDEKS
jgi:hypothetical protein